MRLPFWRFQIWNTIIITYVTLPHLLHELHITSMLSEEAVLSPASFCLTFWPHDSLLSIGFHQTRSSRSSRQFLLHLSVFLLSHDYFGSCLTWPPVEKNDTVEIAHINYLHKNKTARASQLLLPIESQGSPSWTKRLTLLTFGPMNSSMLFVSSFWVWR